ncbi:lamin tail domain-containing protein [Streptomyces sp. CBMA29]|uniref:lamin tail domain-containing protein n=1 Tax=Streptomyces sp. CBMA29 TaxID=1896314 RepID=UPI001661C777|nr:lamin tail domain-containing protein [Streptomyces sp. CBMA29]
MKINEVESNGGTPGDWVELVNSGAIAVDVSGWLVKDNDDSHVFTIAAGTSLAPGGFLALDVDPVFGLGSADSARLFLPDGVTLVDAYSWTAHAATTYGRCPDGTGGFVTTTASTKGAANDCGAPSSAVKINEVESNGGTPGDWVELTNTSPASVDISGWLVKDNDDSHVFTVPAGTSVAPGGFLALDVESAFGLGSADSARLFLPDGTTLVDAYSWTAHAATTYGRCPDGTGDFETTAASTKGAANACAGQVAASPWPGGSSVTTVDGANVFGTNLSGLAYEGSGGPTPGVLWAVKNGPSTLYRLEWDGAKWAPDTADGWSAGKALHYPDGTGDPDAEGVALTGAGPSGGVFVSTERDNSHSGVSRPEVLRFDPPGPSSGTSLNATREWNLTSDLPPVGANSGLEGITWVPDSYLTSHGFRDQHTGAAYSPAVYPGHGDGLFFVGLEGNGSVYAYALDQSGSGFTRVAAFASGFPSVMELQFDAGADRLWVVCDDTCNGRTATFAVGADGDFAATDLYERPASMPNLNNEGFVFAPQSECVSGRKPVFWSDDSDDDGHALRAGTINCPAGSGTYLPDAFSDVAAGGTTSGRVVVRGGRTVLVSDARDPAGVLVYVGPGSSPAQVQLTGSAVTLSLGRGSYEITGSGRTTTVRTVDGEPAVLTAPVAVTVARGASLTYTETPSGLSGVRHTGSVTFGPCTGIDIDNVIVGTPGNDRLTGTPANDLILGRGGNDTVDGGGGSDCVVTGTGNDRISLTGNGPSYIDAGGGNNVVSAGGGANVVLAGSGNDQITTGGGDDRIDAGGGNNVVNAGDGANVVLTGSGNDRITTGGGADTIDAGAGNNVVSAGDGPDTVRSASGNDSIDCGPGLDTAHPGPGNNTNVGARCETFSG